MTRVPVVPLGAYLLATVQSELYDSSVTQLEDDIATLAAAHEPRAVLLDLRAVHVVDAFIAHAIDRVAQLLVLLGSRLVIVGARPAVALALVEIGLSATHVTTAATVERAMEEIS